MLLVKTKCFSQIHKRATNDAAYRQSNQIKEQKKTSTVITLLNSNMKSYRTSDVVTFFGRYEKHITHICVAHTNLRVYGKNEIQIRQMRTQVAKDIRHALNVFCSSLYLGQTNKVRRNPLKYKPLIFSTIEGTTEIYNKQKTIHVNLALGNLPKHLTTNELKTLFQNAWVNKANQNSDIFFQESTKRTTSTNFIGYALKEAQIDSKRLWDESSVWDVGNCWIPHIALNAD